MDKATEVQLIFYTKIRKPQILFLLRVILSSGELVTFGVTKTQEHLSGETVVNSFLERLLLQYEALNVFFTYEEKVIINYNIE